MHKNLAVLIQSWALEHPKQIFFIQEAGQVDGIHVPLTLSIHTTTQYENMLTFGHSGAISMDTTFGMNDVKYHLFTLMGFDAHHKIIPLAWVITS